MSLYDALKKSGAVFICAGLLVTTLIHAQTQPAVSPPAEHSGYPLDNIPWNDRTPYDRTFNASYEDENTFKLQRIYQIDPFIWAYTPAFADKFRMPREWIDPDLKGALAVAWRMTSIGKNYCGYGKNPQSCWPRLTCQLDVYFDAQTPLPWNYTDVVRDNMMDGLTSDSYLPLLSPNSKGWRYIDTVRKSPKGPPLPTGRVQLQYLQGGSVDVGGLRLWLFDREYEPGVVLLSYQGACPAFDGEGPAVLNYHTQQELTRTGGWKPVSVHTVQMSEAYIKQIRATYLVQNKPNRDVTQRLYEQYEQHRRATEPSAAPLK